MVFSCMYVGKLPVVSCPAFVYDTHNRTLTFSHFRAPSVVLRMSSEACVPGETPLEKSGCQLEVASWLVRGAYVYFPLLFSTGIPSGLDLCRLCVCCQQSLTSYVHQRFCLVNSGPWPSNISITSITCELLDLQDLVPHLCYQRGQQPV